MPVLSFASACSKIPEDVLCTLRADIAEWQGSGLSALELPFTDQAFADIAALAEHDLRVLLDLPDCYRVLFLQGGASAQFTFLPMNLFGSASHCDYVESGHWSRRAIAAARPYGDVRVIAGRHGSTLSDAETWDRRPMPPIATTRPTTADGLQFHTFEAGDVPLVADMTADFLTRPIPPHGSVSSMQARRKSRRRRSHALIVHQDRSATPTGRRPSTTAVKPRPDPVNTPPTFAVIVASRMLAWLRAQGGLAAAQARNEVKSAKLYAAIDDDGFVRRCRPAAHRSACASISPTPRSTSCFSRRRRRRGLPLRGHPDVGGIRASLYARFRHGRGRARKLHVRLQTPKRLEDAAPTRGSIPPGTSFLGNERPRPRLLQIVRDQLGQCRSEQEAVAVEFIHDDPPFAHDDCGTLSGTQDDPALMPTIRTLNADGAWGRRQQIKRRAQRHRRALADHWFDHVGSHAPRNAAPEDAGDGPGVWRDAGF